MLIKDSDALIIQLAEQLIIFAQSEEILPNVSLINTALLGGELFFAIQKNSLSLIISVPDISSFMPFSM